MVSEAPFWVQTDISRFATQLTARSEAGLLSLCSLVARTAIIR